MAERPRRILRGERRSRYEAEKPVKAFRKATAEPSLAEQKQATAADVRMRRAGVALVAAMALNSMPIRRPRPTLSPGYTGATPGTIADLITDAHDG